MSYKVCVTTTTGYVYLTVTTLEGDISSHTANYR